MSNHQSKITNALSEETVAAYLRQYPTFFERHPRLLASLKLPHPITGEAISLVERQMMLLRDYNRNLERKLKDLVQIARENERLSVRLHKFSADLLEARSVSDVLAVTQDVIRDLFETDFVTVKLLSSISEDTQICIDSASEVQLFTDFLSNKKPVCGRLTPEQARYLFTDAASDVASSAMIPLESGRSLGVMALGSRDEQRFNPGMGHLFLSHLGELVSSALAVHLSQD